MLEKFPDCLEWKEDDVIKIDHEAWYRASLVTVDEKGCWCKPINNNVIFVYVI